MKKLTLLHSNDLHGDFLVEKKDEKLIGGVSLLSGYIKQVRQKEKNVIYCIAGDMFRGSIIDSEYKGISTIEIMNLLGPDVVCIGNHEIDYGLAHLLFIEKCAKFPIINANLYITTNYKRLFEPYKIMKIGGMNIMFIGIITNEILAQAKSADSLVSSFINVNEAAEAVGVICDAYRTTSIDFTVLLTHIGYEEDLKLAAQLKPEWGVDLIVGGHSHTLLEKPTVVNDVAIVQAGCGTDQIGRMDITFDDNGKFKYEWKTVEINDQNCQKDYDLEDVINHYKNETDTKYQRIITSFIRPLTHPDRYQETELGNLFADILQDHSSFDLMIIGSGSIRSAVLGPILQLQDLKECFPYDDSLYLLTVTGAQLRRMMQRVFRPEAFLEGTHTEFYQYSKGFHIRFNKEKNKIEELRLKGKEITDDQMIRIALQKFHYTNFEEFFGIPLEEILKGEDDHEISSSVFAQIAEELSNKTHINSTVEGRIEIV